MKIFITHSSANKLYGNVLVDLLRGVGILDQEIIYTSNIAYGIPIGQNIFNWLKSQIAEKPFVIYLLSKEYYSSIACLNEMGAAWIIENEHAMMFLPDFDLSSKEFRDGAIDPREIGFYLNDEERMLSFIHNLDKFFSVTKNPLIINQKLKKYLQEIEAINQSLKLKISVETPLVEEKKEKMETVTNIAEPSKSTTVEKKVIAGEGIYTKFLNDILSGKIKDEEVLLAFYLSDTGRGKLMIGWQEDNEIRNIKAWEEVKEIDNILSKNYEPAVRKFGLRGYTEVSAVTGGGNPKEVKLKSEIENNIIDLPQEIQDQFQQLIKKIPIKKSNNPWDDVEDLPF